MIMIHPIYYHTQPNCSHKNNFQKGTTSGDPAQPYYVGFDNQDNSDTSHLPQLILITYQTMEAN